MNQMIGEYIPVPWIHIRGLLVEVSRNFYSSRWKITLGHLGGRFVGSPKVQFAQFVTNWVVVSNIFYFYPYLEK